MVDDLVLTCARWDAKLAYAVGNGSKLRDMNSANLRKLTFILNGKHVFSLEISALGKQSVK